MKRPTESEFYEPSPLLRELQVLSILARDPEASQKEIAEEVGLAPSMIHNYIHALAGQGLVEFQGPTRRRLRYIVTEPGRVRIEALAGRHLAEAGRLLDRLTSAIRRQIDNAVRDGFRSLGVVARPALAGALSRVAADAGVEIRAVPNRGRDSVGTESSAPLTGFDAVLIAEDPASADVEDTMRRCREQGVRVYHVA